MEIEHFSHEHPLTLSEEIIKRENDELIKCFGCTLSISDGLAYYCIQCKDFALHKSCAELPRQINEHPFHPRHRLLLTRRPVRHRCHSCRNSCVGFFFRCDLCDFDIDTDCAQIAPTVKYKAHPNHLPCLFKNKPSLASDYRQVCSFCHSNCNGLVLRCVPCQFNLHVSCLPHTVKHKDHSDHSLVLTTSNVGYDGSNEYYCDACEERRNLDEPVYYCAKCNYVSHIDCVVSEVFAEQESDSAAPSGKLGSRVSTDPILARLDEDIAAYRAIVEAKVTELDKLKKSVQTLAGKLKFFEGQLKNLEGERARYADRRYNIRLLD